VFKEHYGMNGSKLFLDTNIILYLLDGDKTLAELLNGKQLYISIITELELLAYNGITAKEEKTIKEFNIAMQNNNNNQ